MFPLKRFVCLNSEKVCSVMTNVITFP
uniref:Uncharacterized protein n=1 Tax=Anguilla anguilla TaxID=7936 RepID=A0A0E9U3E1_ANGAN